MTKKPSKAKLIKYKQWETKIAQSHTDHQADNISKYKAGAEDVQQLETKITQSHTDHQADNISKYKAGA
ncbi:MAG: hypothetical protein GY737_14665 [Desulfobacteraceae bacterium]|nr:hypothetical protein [Desulfobacteraceae bacterium]